MPRTWHVWRKASEESTTVCVNRSHADRYWLVVNCLEVCGKSILQLSNSDSRNLGVSMCTVESNVCPTLVASIIIVSIKVKRMKPTKRMWTLKAIG